MYLITNIFCFPASLKTPCTSSQKISFLPRDGKPHKFYHTPLLVDTYKQIYSVFPHHGNPQARHRRLFCIPIMASLMNIITTPPFIVTGKYTASSS